MIERARTRYLGTFRANVKYIVSQEAPGLDWQTPVAMV